MGVAKECLRSLMLLRSDPRGVLGDSGMGVVRAAGSIGAGR